MRRRLLNLLAELGVAFGSIAAAIVVTVLLKQLHLAALPRIAPFFFLLAVLLSAWKGGYTGGIASVLFTHALGNILVRHDPWQIDYYRFSLMVLLAIAVSWIEHHRRHREEELRAGVEQKTTELQAAIADLEREIRERNAAETEVRRLNRLLEQRVDERTRQLEISNQELESFSYSVSHDLRAPLRSIDGFSRILLTTCPAKLDDEEKALFQRILAATGKMNELIDDLLNLARVTRTSMHAEPVDLSAIASRNAAELRREYPETRTKFVIQPGLTAVGDVGLIDVVMRNLLENAWKFSAQSPEPLVEFGEANVRGENALFVRDNGAGFDPAYKSKLFSPFQRLHRQEEFPGTGIGLATVARIVHRHGGWINAESQPGQGATFYFTLRSSQRGSAQVREADSHEEIASPSATHSALTS